METSAHSCQAVNYGGCGGPVEPLFPRLFEEPSLNQHAKNTFTGDTEVTTYVLVILCVCFYLCLILVTQFDSVVYFVRALKVMN